MKPKQEAYLLDECELENMPYMTIDFSMTCSSSDEPEDRFLTRFDGKVKGYTDRDEEVIVGFCKVTQIRLGEGLNNGFSHLDLFDLDEAFEDISEPLLEGPSEFSTELYDKYENQLTYVTSVLVIERLEILPEYRGKGYGHKSISLLLSHLDCGPDCIAVLKAYPLQYESERAKQNLSEERREALGSFNCSFEQSLKNLVDYYSMAGFELFNSDCVMVKPIYT